MSTTLRTDIVVVGLGAMGAAVLHQLAKRGIDAVGVDSHVPPHDLGSSHGETRITRLGIGEGAEYVPLVMASHRIWREIEAESGATLLEQCGCLILDSSGEDAVHHGKPGFFDSTVESARAFGIAHEVMTGAEAMRRYPTFRGAEQARAYFEPDGGFLRPERCIAAQLTLARQAGARILRAPVRSVAQFRDRVRVEAGEMVIEAERAVVAAGAWTGPLMGAPFDGLLTVSRQVLHWFPVDEAEYAPGQVPAYIWMHGREADGYFYGFPALPGSGLIKAATEQYEIATTPETVDRLVAPVESAAFRARHLAGRLAGVGARAVRAATCLYTVTPDSRFIVDRHPAMDRVTVISACSGHGFKHSAGIGESVALNLAGHDDGRLAPFSLARFGSPPAA